MFDSSSEMEVKWLQIFKIVFDLSKGRKKKENKFRSQSLSQHDSNKYLNLEVKRVHLVDLA